MTSLMSRVCFLDAELISFTEVNEDCLESKPALQNTLHLKKGDKNCEKNELT